ncbi:MAG TPA: ammonium transporter [Acidimicrobiales bacterium]|nr:ammonium transporter [Acidimicrobiales bacterium]
MKRKLLTGAAIAGAGVMAFASPVAAQDVPEGAASQVVLDNIWVFIAGALVFFMQAGFALVEAGLTRAKNVANIMMKNLMDCMAGVLAFLVIGYSIGFGNEGLGGWFSWDGLGVTNMENPDALAALNLSPATFFFFQAAFAATAATIVSGAMAERTKFKSYFVYSLVITALIYPVVLSWTWGGGWLAQREFPFSDFAGSTIVHATGGWAALMGAIVLGPRIGKYGPDGKPRAIPGHSIAFVVLGALILFIGWFGFNPGSELAADSLVPQLAVKTLVAGCAGAVVAMLVNWALDKSPDVSMAANGLLAGLVSITAPVGAVETWAAVLIGAIGGAIVVLAVKMFDRIKVDDPVGAISVHGVCGTWGTLSIGLFATYDDAFLGRTDAGLLYGGGIDQLVTQLTFVVVHAIWVCGAAGLLFLAIKKTIGLRVSPEEEIEGLDVMEHGTAGYGIDVVTSLPSDGASGSTAPAEPEPAPA